MASKPVLFSVTIKDCVIQTIRSNVLNEDGTRYLFTGIRITHEPSGARGEGRDSQHVLTNKRVAFDMMTEKEEFKSWVQEETFRRVKEQLFGSK